MDQHTMDLTSAMTPERHAYSENAVQMMLNQSPEESFQDRERSSLEAELLSMCWEYGATRYTRETVQGMTRTALCEALYPLVLAYHQERARQPFGLNARVKALRGWFKDEIGTITAINPQASEPYSVRLDAYPKVTPCFVAEGLALVDENEGKGKENAACIPPKSR